MHRLVASAIVLVALIASLLLQSAVSAGEQPGTVWIDARTAEEFAEGHLEGAILIPYDTIKSGISALGLEKDRPINVYCHSGRRSGIAAQELQKLGYTRVTNVGGLEDAQKMSGQMK